MLDKLFFRNYNQWEDVEESLRSESASDKFL